MVPTMAYIFRTSGNETAILSRFWVSERFFRLTSLRTTSYWLCCQVGKSPRTIEHSSDFFFPFAERQVITFPLDALDHMDPLAGLKRAKRIASHITFFKTGVCLGKTLVCVVKASPLSSTIKTLEPIDQNIRGRNRPTFRSLLQGGNDTLRVFKVSMAVNCRTRSPIIPFAGILYPSAVEFDTLLEDKVVCRVPERLRDRGPGDFGYPRPARSRR